MTAKRKAKKTSWGATHERERAPGRLGEVVTTFRQAANLHANSPDDALVRFAFFEGKERPGADKVREAFIDLRREQTGRLPTGIPVDTADESGENAAPGEDGSTDADRTEDV